MIKNALLAAALGVAAAASAQTDGVIKVILPKGTQEIAVTESTIADYYSGSRPVLDTVSVAGQTTYEIAVDPQEAMAVTVRVVDRPVKGVMHAVSMRPAMAFAAPGEQITIDLTLSQSPATGSALMDNISAWNVEADSLVRAFREMGESATDEERQAFLDSYTDRIKGLVTSNADNAFGVYMLTMMTSSPDLPDTFEQLDADAAKSTILSPLYESLAEHVGTVRARERAAEKIKVGLPAPGFTLPAPDGSMVSLAEYRGKWVMLDFWGSWCGWCIKGIPQMKEEWAELKDRNVVFISVACQDSKEAWLGALEKYELPWVNAWQDPALPRAEQLPGIYAVSGYPTKMVIDPEGNIALIVVGEDPSFYNQLKALLPAD